MSPVEPTDTLFPKTFWALLLGIPFLFFSVMYFVDGRPMVDEQWWLDEIEGVLSESRRPPDASADWDLVAIPGLYRGQSRNRTSIWWRIPITGALAEAGAEWTLVIPFPALTNFSLFLGERPIDTRGDMDSPQSMLRNPVVFRMVNAPGTPTSEYAHLHTTNSLESLKMSSVLVGPRTELSGYVRYIDIVQRFLPQAIMAMMGMMSAIMGAVFLLRRRRDPEYGWYALMLLIWSGHLLHSQNESPPFGDADFWVNASMASLGWFVLVAAVFVDRFLGQQTRHLGTILLLWGVVGSAFVLGTSPEMLGGFFFIGYVWVPSIIATGLYIVYRLARAVMTRPSVDDMGLLILAFFLLAVGLRDYAYNNLQLLPGNVLYLRFAAGLALITFAILLIRRFVEALDTAETMNDVLEARVEEKAQALDTQYEKTRELEREQVLVQERQRLLQEMHDGLGGHIVHALAAAESDEALTSMVSPLKLAMEDLRLIIDSLDPTESAFDAVFSSLRARFSRTANSLGIEFSWQFDPELEAMELNPHEVLTLARIVQEAVTNVVKHAQATKLTIEGHLQADGTKDGTTTISISDNGIGLRVDRHDGRGLTSMQSRARELGAELSFEELHPGTRVLVSFQPE